jgi:tetratricopeptide (TPR) repeat protein
MLDIMAKKVSSLARVKWIACLLLLPVSVSAGENWVEVRSPHFTVSGNAGEKEARRIANQFEEIRSVFQTAFTSLRVDFGKPLIIIAVKNDDSLKILLPDYYLTKDRMRPAGMYLARFDRNFALLRTDVSGSAENPYHSLYHEYTHGIMGLNFPAMPTWLNEGLAEFYGNTTVDSGEIGIGRISKMQLTVLQRAPFIPIQTLMNVDSRSPLYNERDRVSMFYAESWALVHYLMLDPDARKNQIMARFLKVLEETNDSEEAARQAFGDLKKFGDRLESYTRQTGFYYQKLKPQTHFSDKDYTARPLSPPEVLALQGDFLEHSGHGKDAKTMLREAIEQQPKLAAAYSTLAMYDFQQHDNDAAEKEFEQALQLDPGDFRSYYYLADILYRRMGYREESTPQIIKHLENLVKINPDFAPAHAFLSVAYRQQKETREKALTAGIQAAKLDPIQLAYVADIGDALLALDRDKDARFVGEKLTKRARTPYEKAIAENFNKRLTRHEEMKAKNLGKETGDALVAAEKATVNEEPDDSAQPVAAEKAAPPEPAQHGGSEEGLIREAHCDSVSGATVKFAILGDTLLLEVPDLTKIEYRSSGKESTLAANPCSGWNNRKARITYVAAKDKKFQGEITAIEFQ